MAHIIIVHRWQGNPNGDWYPWLKKELDAKGHSVIVPKMPDPNHPTIQTWIAALSKVAGKVDESTFFVGHSIGCQTILRYLPHIPNNEVAGGVVLVAPWTKLKPTDEDTEEDIATGRPWVEMPLPWELAKVHAKKFFCLFSDDDPYVYTEEEKTFKQKLGAETKMEHAKGHYTELDGIKHLPVVLGQIEKMIQKMETQLMDADMSSYLLSHKSLAKLWDRPEEDEAWKNL